MDGATSGLAPEAAEAASDSVSAAHEGRSEPELVETDVAEPALA